MILSEAPALQKVVRVSVAPLGRLRSWEWELLCLSIFFFPLSLSGKRRTGMCQSVFCDYWIRKYSTLSI